jgi:hypothetical protein
MEAGGAVALKCRCLPKAGRQMLLVMLLLVMLVVVRCSLLQNVLLLLQVVQTVLISC